MQANFWKLVNNAYFGFDCRGNSQNKYLHLIYDENAEVEFISKYSRYDANNCFLYLDARIKNIEEYYSNLDNLEDDGQSYAETLKQEEIKRVIETYNSLEFIVIAEESCDCGEREMSDILLTIFLDNDIQHRLDLSGEFFAQFSKRNEAVHKQVGLYEFEDVEHGIICAICINPKEYFEIYGIYYKTNKKHKGVRKEIKGMEFDNYASFIFTLEEVKEVSKRFAKKLKQTRFQNK